MGWLKILRMGARKKKKKTEIATVVLETDGKPSLPPSFCPSGKSVRSSRICWAKIVLLWAPPDRPPSWTWTSRDTSHTSGNTHTHTSLCITNMMHNDSSLESPFTIKTTECRKFSCCSPFWLWPLLPFSKDAAVQFVIWHKWRRRRREQRLVSRNVTSMASSFCRIYKVLSNLQREMHCSTSGHQKQDVILVVWTQLWQTEQQKPSGS